MRAQLVHRSHHSKDEFHVAITSAGEIRAVALLAYAHALFTKRWSPKTMTLAEQTTSARGLPVATVFNSWAGIWQHSKRLRLGDDAATPTLAAMPRRVSPAWAAV
mmetsp:Transcript_124427/g.248176  ORF Transcript_124427/g.248176 Transcript_124427/m.248176 type:complete len:105 (-) Transcript_124427:166-480(-)